MNRILSHCVPLVLMALLCFPAGAETVCGKAEKSHKDKRYTV